MEKISLANEMLRLDILPEYGAILDRFEAKTRNGWQPVFEPSRFEGAPDPTKASLFSMLPWCNRLSAGGVWAEGALHSIDPNWHTTSMPVHGFGWLEKWKVVSQGKECAQLELNYNQRNLYAFSAQLEYTLFEETLKVSVAIRNCATVSLPFGIGFHPYFPKHSKTIWKCKASGKTSFNGKGLPKLHEDFARPKTISLHFDGALSDHEGLYNVDGPCRVIQPAGAASCTMTSSPRLHHVQIWAPEDATFFCAEPLSHPVDAFSRAETARSHLLEPQMEITAWTRFEVE